MAGILKKWISLGLVIGIFILVSSPGMIVEQDNEGEGLQTITVESERLDWEKLLSPGTVSVVFPEYFVGEQKGLADMLDQVPGLFVNRVTGSDQYTTVQICGSTAAQVNVYVDGVLQNLGHDMAVYISLIPVSQVARIEVYRGYIPVRFAGSLIRRSWKKLCLFLGLSRKYFIRTWLLGTVTLGVILISECN